MINIMTTIKNIDPIYLGACIQEKDDKLAVIKDLLERIDYDSISKKENKLIFFGCGDSGSRNRSV